MLALAAIVILLLPFCNKPLLTVVMLPVVAIRVAVPKLPTLALPDAFNVPVMFAPVPLTVNVALPAELITTLALAAGIATLLLPLVNALALILPAVTLPLTVKPVNVPTDVTFGCAAVVNVPVK